MLEKQIEALMKRIAELEKRLLAYENAHTPSSKRYKRRLPPSASKSGAPIGHAGATRPDPKPTLRVELVKERCDYCQGRLGKPWYTIRRFVEEIPDPQPVEVTEYRIPYYLCPTCGECNCPDDIPMLGRFGPKTCAHVAVLKFGDRLPHAKVVQAVERQFGLALTPPTVLSITNRVAESTRKTYECLRKRILKAPFVHVDETDVRVAGRKYWVWVFCTPAMTFYVIQPTRGGRVVQEVLGDYKGIVVSDGYKVYEGIGKAQQRCWAHLLREAEWLAQQHDTAKPMYEQLKHMYHEAKTLIARSKSNKAAYDGFVLQMSQLIELCTAYKEMRKFATTLKNGLHAWFTALIHKGIPLTNNLAERQLREIVVQRKIFGTLRTNKGTRIMETIMSLLMTFQQQGKNTLKELTKLLTPTPT